MKHQIRDQRNPGWLWLSNALLDEHGAALGPTGIAVYVALCRYADNASQACFPSQAALGRMLGISVPTARRALEKLVERKLISIEPRYDEGGRQTSNLYTLLDLPPVERFDTPPGVKTDTPGEVSKLSTNKTYSELDSMNNNGDGADAPPPSAPMRTRQRSEKDQMRQALEEHFHERTNIPLPWSDTKAQERQAGSLWWAPLREILELTEWDLDKAQGLIDAALESMEGLTISSPKSILNNVRYVYSQRGVLSSEVERQADALRRAAAVTDARYGRRKREVDP